VHRANFLRSLELILTTGIVQVLKTWRKSAARLTDPRDKAAAQKLKVRLTSCVSSVHRWSTRFE